MTGGVQIHFGQQLELSEVIETREKMEKDQQRRKTVKSALLIFGPVLVVTSLVIWLF
jgi:predicted nucleic acid-binding Zn ribbon protein